MAKTTCGDHGGTTSSGRPCRRPSRDGLCADHEADGVADRKARFLEEYREKLTISDAAKAVGVTDVTVWRWRKSDPTFAAEFDGADAVAADLRYKAVADSVYSQVVSGTASAALTIFWLTNRSRVRGDEAWKHRREVEHSGRLGVFGSIVRMPEDEVRRLLDLDPEEQEAALRRMFPELGDPESPRDGRDRRGRSGGLS